MALRTCIALRACIDLHACVALPSCIALGTYVALRACKALPACIDLHACIALPACINLRACCIGASSSQRMSLREGVLPFRVRAPRLVLICPLPDGSIAAHAALGGCW